jgi:phospholipase/carboxylesterase
MACEAPRNCTFTARLDCHYLVDAPATVAPRTLLIVALHGFASTPETMLRLTVGAFGSTHVLAAIQGPNQFYLSPDADQIGYGWITSRHAPSSIRLHHDMVRHVLQEAGREYGIPPERRVLLGFSQSVGLNYRFAATFPAAIGGVVAICGGLPSDWDEAPYRTVTAAVLHIARREDEYYPPAVTGLYPERLRRRAADVEFHLLEGGHRFPSRAKPIVDAWVERIMGAPPAPMPSRDRENV